MATTVRDLTCLGSSSSMGHGDRVDFNLGWVSRLGQSFHEANSVDDVELGPFPTFYNLSVLGDTAVRLSNRAPGELAARARPGRARLTVVSIGCNDAAKYDSYETDNLHPVTSLSAFKDSIRSLFNLLVDGNNRALYVGLTPFDEARTKRFRGRNMTFLNAEALEFEQAAVAISKACGANAVPLFERAMAANFVETMLDKDGLHPNSAGHQWILEQVLPIASELWS